MLTQAEIERAADRLAPYLQPTPVLRSAKLDALAGCTVLLKAECLNTTGSFKIRGALNRMLCIPASEREAGVVAMSSGNHAQAVAQAARWLNLQATIVMPSDAPKIKRRNTEALGATVVPYNRASEDREAIAQQLAEQSGATIVHPYDDVQTMAGQGTAGLELVHYARAHQLPISCLAAPCSGGGLIAGVGTAVQTAYPQAQVYAVEPNGYEDHQQSLQQHQRVALQEQPVTLCDALQAPTPGEKTFQVNQKLLAGAVSVSDAQVLKAIAFAALELKLVLEPGGAAALAALMAGKLVGGATGSKDDGSSNESVLGILLSGGNLDPELLSRAIAFPPSAS